MTEIKKTYNKYCRKLDGKLQLINSIRQNIQKLNNDVNSLFAEANKLNGRLEMLEELHDEFTIKTRKDYLKDVKEH